MDNFDKCESIGREKFSSLLMQMGISQYQFTKDKFNPVDCYYITKDGTRWCVEIKVRSQFWNPLFMELSKWKQMMQVIKEGKADKGMYVNFIDDRCFIFLLSCIHPKYGCYTTWQNARWHTASPSESIDKRMINIPTKLALTYQVQDNIWKKV